MNYIFIFHIFKSRNNLAISMKNLNSILKAHPVFNHEAGYAPHLRETHGLALAYVFSFPPSAKWARSLLTGARAALKGYQAEEGPRPWTQSRGETGQHPWGFQNQHWHKLPARGPWSRFKVKASWCYLKVTWPRSQKTCKYPAMHAPFFYSHSHPCLHLP